MKQRIKEHLLPLLDLSGVSGREGPVARYMMEKLKPLVDQVLADPMGNVFAVKKGSLPGPKVLIAAHSDEIGLLVKSIEPSGFLRFEKIGGVQDCLLPGRVVNVKGLVGIVGVKAGHLASEKERSEVKKASELYIDIGARSKEEAEKLGITPGTPVTFISEPRFLANPDLIVSRALDDRTGCAVLLALMESLKDAEFGGEVVVAVTVQEEVGLRGAQVAAFRIRPDVAIALDTIPSGDTPDVNFAKELPVAIGKGPVLQVMSGGGARGMFADTTVIRMLQEAAKRKGIPYQLTTFTGGNTDASAMHLVAEGIPSCAVTIPRRYSHSPVELLDINDAAWALELLREFVCSLPEKIDWRLPGE